MDSGLRERWQRLVAPLAVGEAEATHVLRDLWRRYDEPHRAFHTVSHLRHVLDVVDFLHGSEPAHDPTGVELAAWFHDAVYDPASEHNEERSAQLAADTLLGWDVPDARVAHVVDLVLATRTHLAADHDTAVLIDADLAVLASPPDSYDLYRRGVRVEYRHLDEAQWRSGRAAFLRSMLARDRLFTTATMRERGETVARHNLSTELGELGPDRDESP